MKKRFTDEQIIGILKEAEAGLKVAGVRRKHGISDATYYNSRSKFGGMSVSEPQRLKALELRTTNSNVCWRMHIWISQRSRTLLAENGEPTG